MPAKRQATGVRTVARYKMTVVFNAHEELEMKHVYQERADGEKTALTYEDSKENVTVIIKGQLHINRLYDDVIERIETSPKHPITYDIVSFEKLKEE
jgi:hypothetical protein